MPLPNAAVRGRPAWFAFFRTAAFCQRRWSRIPCFLHQTLNAVRLATSDEKIHVLVLREVLKAASIMDLDLCPPLMGQQIHRTIRKYTGSPDPYRSIKDRFNRYALSLFPELQAMVQASCNPFESAVRLAAVRGSFFCSKPNVRPLPNISAVALVILSSRNRIVRKSCQLPGYLLTKRHCFH